MQGADSWMNSITKTSTELRIWKLLGWCWTQFQWEFCLCVPIPFYFIPTYSYVFTRFESWPCGLILRLSSFPRLNVAFLNRAWPAWPAWPAGQGASGHVAGVWFIAGVAGGAGASELRCKSVWHEAWQLRVPHPHAVDGSCCAATSGV